MNRLPTCRRLLVVSSALAAVIVVPRIAAAERWVSSFSELQAALSAANAGSGDPVIVMRSGTHAVTAQLWVRADGVTIRGEGNSPQAVVLEGSGMTSGITHVFQIVGHDVTLENLTLRNVSQHAVQVHGESPYSADRTVLRSLLIQDTGEQMVKISYRDGDGSTSDDGLVENCTLEYTAGIGPQWYIGGVDGLSARNWTVRGCTFRGIRSPESSVAGHAVLFWAGSEGSLVERNRIINCDRGVGFGLSTRGHQGGIIRNNMIYHADLGADRGDVGIELETAGGAQVYNNTVFQEHGYQAAISARFATSDVSVTNNLIRVSGGGTGAIWARNGATITASHNVVDAQASWFVDPSSGDLHLLDNPAAVVDQGVPVSGLTEDFDGQPRPLGAAPEVGADEVPSNGSGPLLLGTWGWVKAEYRN